MNIYRITNITNLLPKRDRKFNTAVNIEYVDKMIKKSILVKPKDDVFLSVPILPLSVHRLRIKNLITVMTITPPELGRSTKKPKVSTPIKMKSTKKPVVDKKVETEKEKESDTIKSSRRKSSSSNSD